MKSYLFALACPLPIVALLSGCSTSSLPSAPTAAEPPSASANLSAQLEGTWAVVSIQPAGQRVQERPASATYAITFADGRLSTRTDCNVCSGGFSIAGDTLTAGPNLACTRAFCQTASFESAYTSLLSGDSVATATGSTLTLASPRGSIVLAR